jgi:mono/diheme cytochrome c family protein
MPRPRFLDLSRHVPSAAFVGLAVLLFAGAAGAVIYGGAYDIGADAPHSKIVYRLIDTMRDRSIAVRSSDIPIPADLNDPKRIAIGAGLYAGMCSGCHLAPGMEKSELSQGLYPQAPELARDQTHSTKQQFWMIKHGVKLSAMPAWGKTHSDDLMWDMVAFVRQLPKLSPESYAAIVKSAPADHDAMMKDMPGMAMSPAKPHP